jgi:hypothetical protein
MESVCLDSTTVKVHPNGTGALKKEGSKASEDHEGDLSPEFIWSPRLTVWIYDTERDKQRNEIERYFLRLKRFRKIFIRYDTLDVLFCGFLYFAMIVDALFCVNRI